MPVLDISQLPAAVNEPSDTAGAERVPLDTVTFPLTSKLQEASLVSKVPPLTKRFPVTVRSRAAVSKVPAVTVRSLVAVSASCRVQPPEPLLHVKS